MTKTNSLLVAVAIVLFTLAAVFVGTSDPSGLAAAAVAAGVAVAAAGAVGAAASSDDEGPLIEKIRATIHERALEASKASVVGGGVNPGPDESELRISQLEAGIKQLQQGLALNSQQLDIVIKGPSVWKGWWVVILLGCVSSGFITAVAIRWDDWLRGVLQ